MTALKIWICRDKARSKPLVYSKKFIINLYSYKKSGGVHILGWEEFYPFL
jgi:hypothetical protein